MPHRALYDIEGSTSRLLEVLTRHSVHAMFFVVGRMVEERPDLVARIHEAGQAVGVHGYRHVRLNDFSPRELDVLERNLLRVRDCAAAITGQMPVAFRAPYLLWPRFADECLARRLVKIGFRWTSCRFLRTRRSSRAGGERSPNGQCPSFKTLAFST
jgi:peptidoglycan/xylan/chitin deacetylase (PgdA/CDA1 family)